MTVYHVVQITWSKTATKEEKKDYIDRFLALRTLCKNHQGQNYVREFHFGTQNSVEGLSDGVDFVVVSSFDSVQDRDYYALKDPAHLAFVKHITSGTALGGIRVVDLEDGIVNI